MSTRGKWQGMLSIALFNWPFYVAAVAVFMASWGGVLLSSRWEAKLACGSVLAGAAYFLFGSLGVSHLIYDRSDLYRWRWLDRALRGASTREFIFCHSGFDETSRHLREKFPEVHWQVLDHFDPARMTEGSIRRARRMFPSTPGTLPAPYHQWPLETRSADVVFGMLAIHELRNEAERSAWFVEARRCLRGEGRVVLVEHVRDIANFLAFGPGFLHFHSPKSWRRCWERAGFRARDEFRITPWVRAFVLVAS